MIIKNNITILRQTLPNYCKLVAVSKTKPVEMIAEAYDAGQRIFGENKAQELSSKYESLPKDIEWHMIGHMQSNKVKYIAPFVSLIHSVDSLKLLEEINKQAAKVNRVIACLLQVHIAEEETKFGFSPEEVVEFLNDPTWKNLNNVAIVGLMGMATFVHNEEQIRKEFKSLSTLFQKLKSSILPRQVEMRELSMGMSGDYKIAIEEGSTLVRVGSAIFGGR
jgi:PLP dependent protein